MQALRSWRGQHVLWNSGKPKRFDCQNTRLLGYNKKEKVATKLTDDDAEFQIIDHTILYNDKVFATSLAVEWRLHEICLSRI